MQNRIRYIDGLRAVAVLGVAAYHGYQYATAAPMGLTTQLFNIGAHGVDLFFVISGFCLAYPYLWQLRSEGRIDFHPHDFAAKRLVRIVPPYYAAIFILAVAAWLHVYPGIPRADLIREAFFVDWGTHLSNISFWSLAVEWRWYFYFAPVLLLYAWRPWSLTALAASAYLAYCLLPVHVVDLGLIGSFFSGIFAADLHIRASGLCRYVSAFLLPSVVIGALTLPNVIGNFSSPPLQVAAFALVVLAGSNRLFGRILSHRSLTWIGERSYSIYLMHLPVIMMLVRYFHPAWPLATLLSVIAGALFWFLTERWVTQRSVRSGFVRWYVGRAEALPRALRGERVRSVVFRSPDKLIEPGVE
ncbi:MAG TPA: acyltransferase [Candidatus Baltobacteraceae bacterium]